MSKIIVQGDLVADEDFYSPVEVEIENVDEALTDIKDITQTYIFSIFSFTIQSPKIKQYIDPLFYFCIEESTDEYYVYKTDQEYELDDMELIYPLVDKILRVYIPKEMVDQLMVE